MMTSMNTDDPFLQSQTEVLSDLNLTRSLLSSYIRIRSLSPSTSSPELSQARTELETNLQNLSIGLHDLVETVRQVKDDQFHYGLGIKEVERRQNLVNDVGAEVEEMRRELAKTVASASNSQALPHPETFDPDSPANDDDYGAFEQQRQVEMMHEQDEALDDVFQTVGNLRQQADDMGRELGEQGELLEDVSNVATRVESKLQTGMKKIRWVIKKNEDTMSSCCIGVLILVLILLLILVIAL